ncbi:hypothetical protein GRJ2_003443900 [Grus japonensis]|uniref:RNase H type-1 domain-containing protein n=1 Tax=Grus japonensis TaxID=30415 RepID=A0ABC9YL26_GRUJA
MRSHIALFTDGSCRIMGKHRRWKATVWSPTRQVAEAAEGEGESSQFAEVKAIQLALDIAEREKWPTLYLYTDSWMVANALWGWLQQWKQSNWQHRGKPIWAAPLWQDIAARLEKLVVKVHHVDAHVPKSQDTEEHENNQQVDQAAKIEVAQVDLDWQHKGELFIARWAHDTSGHHGRDGTYRWARDRGVGLSMDAISQVIHQCETYAAIKQAKWPDITDQKVAYELIRRYHEDNRDSFRFLISTKYLESNFYDFKVYIKSDFRNIILTNNGLTVIEGEGELITSTKFFVQKLDNKTFQYEVIQFPKHGKLKVINFPGSFESNDNLTTFTNKDIIDKHLMYVHDDSETVFDEFLVRVSSEAAGQWANFDPEVGPLSVEIIFNISVQLKNDEKPLCVIDKIFNIVKNGQ